MGSRNVAVSSLQIPLIIGVTGHRDLVAQEIRRLRQAVRQWLKLQDRFPDAPLQVATSLSPGADLLVAEEALSAFRFLEVHWLRTCRSSSRLTRDLSGFPMNGNRAPSNYNIFGTPAAEMQHSFVGQSEPELLPLS